MNSRSVRKRLPRREWSPLRRQPFWTAAALCRFRRGPEARGAELVQLLTDRRDARTFSVRPGEGVACGVFAKWRTEPATPSGSRCGLGCPRASGDGQLFAPPGGARRAQFSRRRMPEDRQILPQRHGGSQRGQHGSCGALCARTLQPDPVTDPHLPLGCLMQQCDVLRRQRCVLLLQGPYALRVREGDGLWAWRRHGRGIARKLGLVNISISPA